MNIEELRYRALAIQDLYRRHNKVKEQKEWGVAEYMQGFVGDVGDLMKLIMAKEGSRYIENVDQKLEHELADCLWSVLVIAHELDIDVEKAFTKTMDQLEVKLQHGN